MAADLIINVDALKQQMWRSSTLYTSMYAYARRIGCTVIHDEIVCNTEEQSRKMAAWWTEHEST